MKRNSGAKPGDVLILGKGIGVGIFSVALKKGVLDAGGYARMIETTTALNTPGPEIARIAGVHAMTDVTGFGLAGHALEMRAARAMRSGWTWVRCRCWTARAICCGEASSPALLPATGPAMATESRAHRRPKIRRC